MPSKTLPPQAIDLVTTSTLKASREDVWEWITSVDGISREMRPYFRMTMPKGTRNLADVQIKLGSPFAHSHVFLFGFIPAGTWDFTLLELEDKNGFVEESPSTFMKSWRHERRILDVRGEPSSVQLVDHVTFLPKSAPLFTGKFLRRVFQHRHRILRDRFGHKDDSEVICELSLRAL